MANDKMSTEELALAGLGNALGRAERNEQLRRMNEACDSKTLRDIVNDNRVSVFLPSDPGAKVRVSGAGTVVDGGAKNGWVEPKPLRSPDGVREIDEIAAAFDRRDRAKGLL
jgi:hypothetical protein